MQFGASLPCKDLYASQLNFMYQKMLELKELGESVDMLQNENTILTEKVNEQVAVNDYVRQQKISMCDEYAKEYQASKKEIERLNSELTTAVL